MNKSFATLSVGLEIPRRVKEFLRQERFDVVHTMGPFPPSISFFALHYSDALNITTFHSTGFKYYRAGAFIFRKLFKKYAQKLHGLIAVSETPRDTFMPYIPGDYKIIPNGVDLERFNPEVPVFEEFRNKRNKILYLGRLDRRKGLIELLNALPIIKQKIDDFLLIVVGKGPLEDECRRLVKDLDLSERVIFRGFAKQSEIPSYYASCDVYCSPALGGESFGIVLLEAMAVGRPVVASKIPGYDRVIIDGYNGLFFDPHNPQDIADKIICVLKNVNIGDRLMYNARKFVREYSWLNVARMVEEFYREKLNELNH
jgi:phosphatidylinositol alpha-mannosyltransferase